MERGDKFSVNVGLDIEILGFYPKGQTKDGKAKYVCTVNGYKVTVEEDFLTMLQESNKKKGGNRNGRKK